MEYRCSRCKAVKPAGEFPPSRATRHQWCRACAREVMCGPDVDRDCDGCGVTLRVTTRRAAEARVYCSRACKDRTVLAAERDRRLARKAAAPPRFCPWCGDRISPLARIDAKLCPRCATVERARARKAVQKLRDEIIANHGGHLHCHMCGEPCPPDTHMDHLVPVSNGGVTVIGNLAPACVTCNTRRGNAPLGALTKGTQ